MNRTNWRNVAVYAGIGIFVYFLLLTALISFEQSGHHASINNYFDAIWFSVVTFTTVGYGDYYPVTIYGRLIGYVFIVVSIGLYSIIIGQISTIMGNIQENKRLGLSGTSMKEHAIIVGWDPFARSVTEQLVGAGKQVAIITDQKNDIDLIHETFNTRQVFTLFADLNNYDLLHKVNIKKCQIVFINLGDDTAKLVYILNVRKAYPDVQFVVTLDNGNLKTTFNSAGVTHTISKHEISSKLLASYIFEPDVAAYSEDIMSFAYTDTDHDIKQFLVTDQNPYLNTDYEYAFLDLKKQFNCILIGISKKKEEGHELIKNPDPDLKITIEEGDYLIMIMNGKSLKTLSKVFNIGEGILRHH